MKQSEKETDKIGRKSVSKEHLCLKFKSFECMCLLCMRIVVCYARLLTAHGPVRYSQSTELTKYFAFAFVYVYVMNEQAGCCSNEHTHTHLLV